MSETSPLAQALSAPPALREFLLGMTAGLILLAGICFAMRTTKWMTAIRRGLDGFVALLVAIVLLAMVMLSALQILLRNVFDTGLLWIDPLLRHFVLFIALLGGIVATGQKRHIQISFLERFVHGRARRIVGSLAATLAVVICLAIVHAGLLLVRDEIQSGERALFGIPSWILILAIPAGFLAIAIRFANLIFLELAGEAPIGEGADELGVRQAS
ncbi:MAG TPA: TRAP transporter small permease subunit [bacterium]|nr:TRAP transporter small permease subunit [bacterium]